MKKLLLCSAAVAGLMLTPVSANAQVDLKISGHTKNYVGWMEQDTAAASDERNFDILRESEVHIKAEATADNGLTYGFYLEFDVDGGDGADIMDKAYFYLSSDLGRINIGSEDGAAYILQVAAPSADSNIDGLRQYIQPVNYGIVADGGYTNTTNNGDGFDYDNGFSGKNEKLTYISPVWNGFQFALTYMPEHGDAGSASGREGFNRDNVDTDYGEGYEGAVRYEGQFNNVGFILGAGYTHVELELEDPPGPFDDFEEWDVGLDINIGAFGIGAVYIDNNNGRDIGDKDETVVVGVDYKTGPYKFGASYYNKDDEAGLATGSHETDRYTGGVIYTAAPGLTFRGSVSFIDHDTPAAVGSDVEATSVMGGIQFNF